MKFLEEQRLGDPYLRKDVPERAVVWTVRWVHRMKGDGVRSRYVARQLKNASAEADSEVYAATPRLRSIRLLIDWALIGIMFTPVDDEFISDEDHKIYRSVFGRLQFASPRRPDLLFTLKELGRGLAKPTKGHWKLMKHVMRYIHGCSETVLVHVSKRTARGVLRAQADSDWAGCRSTRRSTSCGMIWWSGVLISSYARTQRLQSTIATSSAESEYYGACACASEAVYVKELLRFIGEETQIHLELDASSAISMGSRVGLGEDHRITQHHERSRDRWNCSKSHIRVRPIVTFTDYCHYDGDVVWRLLFSLASLLYQHENVSSASEAADAQYRYTDHSIHRSKDRYDESHGTGGHFRLSTRSPMP
eukprot:6491090-Amphidinium_carterae.1